VAVRVRNLLTLTPDSDACPLVMRPSWAEATRFAAVMFPIARKYMKHRLDCRHWLS
jgi:hypothetical protein